MDEEVQFTDEQWEAVASAAEAFAGVLAEEQVKLRGLIRSNWAGQCAEGETTIENLRSILYGEAGSFAQALEAEGAYLIDFAQQCREANRKLNAVDVQESENFQP